VPIQRLFADLEDPETLTFDDLLRMGISIAVQHMRTPQMRRIQHQQNAWMVAQNFQVLVVCQGRQESEPVGGIHTELLFKAMWEASDVLTTRQIEVWHDPKRRFMTCDAPVLVPFRRNVRPSLLAAQYIIWPVSPSTRCRTEPRRHRREGCNT
jgi:Protein of unknown function (DUF4238)